MEASKTMGKGTRRAKEGGKVKFTEKKGAWWSRHSLGCLLGELDRERRAKRAASNVGIH